MDELRRRLRLAGVDGAEEWSRANLGRTLSSDERCSTVRRYVRHLAYSTARVSRMTVTLIWPG